MSQPCMFFPTSTSGWENLPPIDHIPTWDQPTTPTPTTPSRVAKPPCTPAKPCHQHTFHPYRRVTRLPANTLLEPPSPAFNTPAHRFSAVVQNALSQTLTNAWADSTLSGYSRHVHHFLGFCKQERVPAHLRFPADEFILCAYAASDASKISANMIQNRITGLKAWHNAHNAPWNGSLHLQVVLNGAKNMTPSSSKLPPRPPITIAMLCLLAHHLDLTQPRDVAILACALIAFWGQCRLGELLSSSSADLSTNSKPSRAHFKCSLLDRIAHTLFLPQTKTNRNGERIVLLKQNSSTDPISALCSHLSANNLEDNLPLFAFSTPSGPCALTKVAFLNRCNQIWTKFGYPRSTGHSFRIGGTTELLTTGTAPDVIKTMGRWSSYSFLRYWRDLEIIAPLHARKVKRRNRSD